MHNYYTYLYNRCVFSVIQEERGEGQALVFARSATAGSQKFPVHWGGDNSASYASMAETLRGGLSFALSGFSFWSHDIGGFESTASADLYKRWVQFGAFSTHTRLHGSKSYRVPWNFEDDDAAPGQSASDVLRFFITLKCRLMPYIWGLASEARETGVPVTRPMIMEFPGDPAAAYLDRQYMFGDSILVAPVFNSDGVVDFYLPACGGSNAWTHLLSGETREGGRWYREGYDYLSLPLFARPGSLIPWGNCGARPDYDYTQGTEFRAYGLSDGETASRVIRDLAGEPAFTASVTRRGDEFEERVTRR